MRVRGLKYDGMWMVKVFINDNGIVWLSLSETKKISGEEIKELKGQTIEGIPYINIIQSSRPQHNRSLCYTANKHTISFIKKGPPTKSDKLNSELSATGDLHELLAWTPHCKYW